MMGLVIMWSWLIWRVHHDMVLMKFLGGNSIMKSWYGDSLEATHLSGLPCGGRNVLERPDLRNGVYMELESG